MASFLCFLDCTSFAAGDVVYIRLSLPQTHDHGDHVLAQVFGFLQIDERWSTITPSKGATAPEVASSSHAPFLPSTRYLGLKSYLIFKTEREQLTLPSLMSGVNLSFDLPSTALPTFSGLAGNISYVLGISLYKDHTYYYTKFPLHVHGTGSTSFPVQRYVPLCVNVGRGNISDSDEYSNHSASPRDVSYVIRHVSTLCHATLAAATLQAGSPLSIHFSFVPGHGCTHMVARLLQCEKLLNDKRLQERAVDSQQLHTEYADSIHMSLQLPSAVCSFSCPAFKVSFVLEVEFALLDEDKAKQSFTWSTPIEVKPRSTIRICCGRTTSSEAKVFTPQS